MAKIHPIGQPVNQSEKQAIKYLRDHLPDNYTIYHNFEITQGKEIYEIDLAIVAPHSLFLVDIKGMGGMIDIYANQWYPQGKAPIYSPLPKLRQNAKIFKSALIDANPAITGLKNLYIHAVVLMTAPDVHIEAYDSPDKDNITYLDQRCLTYFKSKEQIPDRFLKDIQSLHSVIDRGITGKAQPKSSPTTYGNWQLELKLSQTDRYKEYRAKHSLLGQKGGSARLRIYQVDPYAENQEQQQQLNLISNAYQSVAHLPPNPHILAVKEFFSTPNQDYLVLVTEDLKGQPLSLYLKKPLLTLTFDQKIKIIKDILKGLNHAHQYEVIHRNLTPDAVLIDSQGEAKLTNFDYARVTKNREHTIAGDIIDDLDYSYHSPECYRDPSQASIASDLFSCGLIFYELLTKSKPFQNTSEIFDCDAIFPIKPSVKQPEISSVLDQWLQTFCHFDPEDRYPSAAVALKQLEQLLTPEIIPPIPEKSTSLPSKPSQADLSNLAQDYILGDRFVIQTRLGKPGGFGVAYQVLDTLADAIRVLKLITKDRQSVYQRLKQEYQILEKLPPHPHIVKVVWADKLNDDTPYIVFDYIQGSNVEELLEKEALSLEDAITIIHQTAKGLAHLHANNVYHLDLKPSNLLWTEQGVKIIDFNVSVSDSAESSFGGGTRRYLPPEFNLNQEPSKEDKIKRDLYALGITLYECITGKHPFVGEAQPPLDKTPPDPRLFKGLEDLSPELVNFMLQQISPHQKDRTQTATEFEQELSKIKHFRYLPQPSRLSTESLLPAFTPDRPNYNPFVTHLLTLYSQSQRTNAGTRGLDQISEATYITTLLDRELLGAILNGEFKLIMISGNAGDGKTAFIQKLERYVEENGANITRGINGSQFTFKHKTFMTNHDGSQDEGDKVNSEVLLDFFAPFTGEDEKQWQDDKIRLIAINEGRLVDFLQEYSDRFPRLITIVEKGLKGDNLVPEIAMINLNLRSVVANLKTDNDSIFDRILERLIKPEFWQPCAQCDLHQKCYIYHNVQTLSDSKFGSQVIQRLKILYTITHLRSRLHLTLRDLRSALAFMLVGIRDCDQIHQLYQSNHENTAQQILDSFYFNSWLGSNQPNRDRLISLLKDLDVGEVSNPTLDRTLAFYPPKAKEMGRFSFEKRSHYDDELLSKQFHSLRDNYLNYGDTNRYTNSRHYLFMIRRRYYFESRGETWLKMLPYSQNSALKFLELVSQKQLLEKQIDNLVLAINRGEGLQNPARLGNSLALRVRQVEKGTIRSYRLFATEQLSLNLPPISHEITRFLEYLSQQLILTYHSSTNLSAQLIINLDIYEMLNRLNQGYHPSREEENGFYRSLSVFKNMLASAPYQEVLLTETGQEFYRIIRGHDGILNLQDLEEIK